MPFKESNMSDSNASSEVNNLPSSYTAQKSMGQLPYLGLYK